MSETGEKKLMCSVLKSWNWPIGPVGKRVGVRHFDVDQSTGRQDVTDLAQRRVEILDVLQNADEDDDVEGLAALVRWDSVVVRTGTPYSRCAASAHAGRRIKPMHFGKSALAEESEQAPRRAADVEDSGARRRDERSEDVGDDREATLIYSDSAPSRWWYSYLDISR